MTRPFELDDEVGYSELFLAAQKEWQARELRPKRGKVTALSVATSGDREGLVMVHWTDEPNASIVHIENIQIVRPKQPDVWWKLRHEDPIGD